MRSVEMARMGSGFPRYLTLYSASENADPWNHNFHGL
jgi:hypothetical protein